MCDILIISEELLGIILSTCDGKLRINARYKCGPIKEMSEDRMHYLCFIFATPVEEIESINSFFHKQVLIDMIFQDN